MRPTMIRDVLKRLAVPLALFGVFASLAFFGEGLLVQFGAEAISQTRRVASYTLQIGIWLASAMLLNRLLAVFFWDMAIQRALGRPVPRLLKDVAGALIYLVAITGIVAYVFQESVTGIWATSGVVGIVLGFALRSLISDVFTGLAINIDRPYQIGEWIMMHMRQRDLNVIGKVIEINWRTTRLRTAQGNMVVVPNSVMGTTVVTNFMQPEPESRLEIFFQFDLGVPSERVLRVLRAGTMAVAGGPGRVLEDPPPKARINEINAQGVEYWVRYWIHPAELTPNKARHLVIGSILDHLSQAGLTLAYPKRDVFHAPMPQRQLDTGSVGDRVALLSRIELFAPLSEKERGSLAQSIQARHYQDGETLIRRGDPGESMFVLVEGLVYVFADHEDTEVRVGQIVPGQFFGEMSMLTGEKRSATITAASETVAYEITKQDVSALLASRPALVEVMSEAVAERQLRNMQALAEASREEQQEEKRTLTRQVMEKMLAFFRGA
jgi:small-conductance mechanosensitive channel/CRP-like cAMP-binding protein